MRALALDIGGSHIGCGVVEDRTLLAHSSISTQGCTSLSAMLPAVTKELNRLLCEASTTAEMCRGIAVGFPGIVDARTNTICSTLSDKYEDAPAADLPAWARREFSAELRMENDARMAALGEHYAGAASDVRDVVMMTLGTGIGTGVIMGGRLLRGVHAHAGCLGGHLTAKFDGNPCLCGNIGCAEAEAAGWSMPAIARGWPGFADSALAGEAELGFRQLTEHAQRGDAVAAEVWERCLRVWSANAVSLIHAYDPAVLVLGGGVMETTAPVVPFVQSYINQHTWSGWGKAEVRKAVLGNTAAFLGAVPLLTEDFHGATL